MGKIGLTLHHFRDGYALYYKGKRISTGGDAKKIKNDLKEIFKEKDGFKRKEALEKKFVSLVKLSPRSKAAIAKMADTALTKFANKKTRPKVAGILQKEGKVITKNYSQKLQLDPGKYPKGLHPLVLKWLEKMYKHRENLTGLPNAWKDVMFGRRHQINHKTSPFHGKCAEVMNISELLKKLDPLGKMTITEARKELAGVVSYTTSISKGNILKHKKYKPACDSCNPMLKYFNITEIKN